MRGDEYAPTLDMQAPPLDPEHCEVCRSSKPSSSGCWYQLPTINVDDIMGVKPKSRKARRRKRVRKLRAGEPYAFETHRRFCYYCGKLLKHYDKNPNNSGWGDSATLDHVVPRARGGSYALLNIVHCCWLCNQRKAAQDHDEFLDALLESDGRIDLSSGASLAEWDGWAAHLSALGSEAAIASAHQRP